MAQIVVTGLSEVLSDKDIWPPPKIAAAQAWCVQQNIRSIDELKSRGEAAVDEFISAAGIHCMGREFYIVQERIEAYAPAAYRIYEGEHFRRSLLINGRWAAARALRMRKALPRLEMPCVRAATSSIGVRLERLHVDRPIRRKIFALAFDLPDEEERLAETRRDDVFMDDWSTGWTGVDTPPADWDPPMIAGAYEAAVEAALGGAPGLTQVAKEMSSLADAPEPYVFSSFDRDFGLVDTNFHTLLPFELAFPALVLPAGCRELTIKSTCRRQADICVGGDVRFDGAQTKKDWLAYHTGELSLPPVERTFTAPRTSPSGISYFSMAELARALNALPEVYRQVGRLTGLVAFDADNDGALSYGQFEIPGEKVSFGACALWLETWGRNATFSAADGRCMLDVEWRVTYDSLDFVYSTVPVLGPGFRWHATLEETNVRDGAESVLEYWCADAHERQEAHERGYHGRNGVSFSSPLHALRRNVVDAKRWAPGWAPEEWQEYYRTGPGFPEPEGALAQDPRSGPQDSRAAASTRGSFYDRQAAYATTDEDA